MSIAWQPKDKADVRQYGVDWSPMLEPGEAIDSVEILRKIGTALADDQTQDGNYTVWTVSGGVNGESTKWLVTMTTDTGNVWRQTIWLPVTSSCCYNYQPSTTTKGEVVAMAFEDVGLPGYQFSATAEENASAIRRLDAMMREWPCGQTLNYNFPQVLGQSDPLDPVLVPDWALTSMFGKLAQKIAPSMGKTLSPAQLNAAARAYSMMLGRIPIPEAVLPRITPRGEGSKVLAPWLPFIIQANCCPGGSDE